MAKKQPTNGVFRELRDESSESVPTIEEMRESQRMGNEAKGTNPEDTKLNECQGHEVDIRD